MTEIVTTNPASNMLTKLRTFFGVSMGEFGNFWKSCTEEEKSEFREAIAKWDGTSEYIS